MKLVSYLKDEHDSLGVVVDNRIYDMEFLHPDLPTTMGLFLNYWEDALSMAQGGIELINEGKIRVEKSVPLNSVQLLAPVPFPTFHQSLKY
jgi:fumarylacetoacetate (FAA) hydrolase